MPRISGRLFFIIQTADDLSIGRENSIGIMSYVTCAPAAAVHFAVDEKPYQASTVSLVIDSSKTFLNKTTTGSYILFAIIALLFMAFRRR
jgi:hypothetical protein